MGDLSGPVGPGDAGAILVGSYRVHTSGDRWEVVHADDGVIGYLDRVDGGMHLHDERQRGAFEAAVLAALCAAPLLTPSADSQRFSSTQASMRSHQS